MEHLVRTADGRTAALLPDLVTAAASLASPAPYGADGLDWFAGMGARIGGESPGWGDHCRDRAGAWSA